MEAESASAEDATHISQKSPENDISENVIPDSEESSVTFNVCYDFNQEREPLLTHQDDSQFKSSDCFTKGCKWAPDGLCFLTNSNDNILRVWDLPENFHNVTEWQANTKVSTIKPSLHMKEGGLIYDFCWYPLMHSWNPVTCCLASASRDSPVHLWDAFTGELRATYRAYNQVDEVEAARSVAFDPEGQRLYCGFKNCVRVFDVATPGRTCSIRNLKTASGDTQTGIVSSIAVCPALSSLFAVGTYMKTIGLYSENTGKALCILRGHDGGITHLRFSEDGLRLYSGGRKDTEILCWDLREPGKVLFSVPRIVTTQQRIYFDLTPDGKFLISGSVKGDVLIWNTNGSINDDGILQDSTKVFKVHNDCANGVSLHHQHPLLVTCSGQRHYREEIFEDSGDELDKQSNENSVTSTENSVKLWWFGPEQTLQIVDKDDVSEN